MNHSRLWVVATIIAVVVLTGFVLSVPHTKDVDTVSLQSAAQFVPEISIRDSFKKGLHTITGSFVAPNACVSPTVRTSMTTVEPDTESILVELSFPEDSGVCLQMPTRVSFSDTIRASANLPIIATVNGIAATTTTP